MSRRRGFPDQDRWLYYSAYPPTANLEPIDPENLTQYCLEFPSGENWRRALRGALAEQIVRVVDDEKRDDWKLAFSHASDISTDCGGNCADAEAWYTGCYNYVPDPVGDTYKNGGYPMGQGAVYVYRGAGNGGVPFTFSTGDSYAGFPVQEVEPGTGVTLPVPMDEATLSPDTIPENTLQHFSGIRTLDSVNPGWFGEIVQIILPVSRPLKTWTVWVRYFSDVKPDGRTDPSSRIRYILNCGGNVLRWNIDTPTLEGTLAPKFLLGSTPSEVFEGTVRLLSYDSDFEPPAELFALLGGSVNIQLSSNSWSASYGTQSFDIYYGWSSQQNAILPLPA